MRSNDNRTTFLVLMGAVLIALGFWLLLGVAFAPIARLIAVLSSIGGPLLLIGLGFLLIVRARRGGFAMNGKQLYRSRTKKMVGGVLGGLSDYLNIDATIIRVAYAFLTLVTGLWWGVLLYILALILVPEEPYPYGWTPPAAPTVPTPPPPAPPAPPVPGPGGSAPTPPPVPPMPSAENLSAEPPVAPPVPQSPDSE